MSRRLRNTLLALGLLVVALLVAGAFLLGPRLGATRTLITFGWPVPDDLVSLEEPPPGYERLADRDVYGVENALLRRVQDGRSHPTLVFVHGVSADGLRDGRILRAIEAFHRGGFTVVAPELGPLTDPTRAPAELEGLDRLLEALATGKIPGANGGRFGLVGISVGAAVALRAGARYQAGGGDGLRGILAIGAPDDLKISARLWFEASDPDEAGGESLDWQRQNAAAFARAFVLRAALPVRVADEDDAHALSSWFSEAARWKEDPPALRTEAARALASLLRAAPAARAAAAEQLLDDAWPRLATLSPAAWTEELSALRGVPVFVLHGEADPLIPVGDADRLRTRLEAHTLVSVLKSGLVGHTAVGDASIAERVDHIVFLDDFFDMVGG
jgi:pimeloyl-ACP methyl ester carboxylesterase